MPYYTLIGIASPGMGTKIHCESYLPGFCSMRDFNENSGSSWPLFYGDKTVTNGQYFNRFVQRTSVDGYPGHGEDTLKQKMLEHEAVFKNQVSELHRLYRIQRDVMDEVRRRELHKHQASREPASSSSSLQGSRVPSKDAGTWHIAGFPLLSPGYGRSIMEAEIFNSAISCTKGYPTQQGLFPLQKWPNCKDSEALDSRPLKVRKKLLDLHLPAEEYVDTEEGEKLQEYKVPDISSYAHNQNPNREPESSGSRAGVKTDCRIDSSASASCLNGGSIGLADLNDPVQIEEEMPPPTVDFLGCASENEEAKCINQPTRSNAGHLSVTGGTKHACAGIWTNSSIESKVNDRGWLSDVCKAGSSRSNLSFVTQDYHPVKLPSPPVQGILNQIHHPLGIYPTGYSKADLWKEGLCDGLVSDRRHRQNNGHLEPIASQAHGSRLLSSSSPFVNSLDRAHPVPSWAKLPTCSYGQKVTTFDASLSTAAAMSRSLQPSAQSQEPSGVKWQVNASSKLNPDLGSESKLNVFYQASVLGSEVLKVDLPSAGFSYLNCKRDNDLASDGSTNHHLRDFPKGSCCADSKPVVGINLNEVISKSPSNEAVILQDLYKTDGESNPEDHMLALPWLKPKLPHVHEVAKCCKNETVRDLNQLFTPEGMLSSSDLEIARKKEIAETQTVKKILGFPIVDRGVPENEPSSLPSTSISVVCHPEGKNSINERKNGIIDINVACEPDDQIIAEDLTMEKEKQKKGTSVRDYIDLNSCVSDCEERLTPCSGRKSVGVKITLEIDLEVPPCLESDDDNTVSKENCPGEVVLASLEDKNEHEQDEVLRDAVEAIVAISSSCPQIQIDDSVCHPSESSLEESLLWFVDALSSCKNVLEEASGKEESRSKDGPPERDSLNEMDDFEARTLQLSVTKEEDYIPRPFVPEVQKVDEATGHTPPTRSRRGQTRIGRQRRDFQRDILPSLAMLSRHELTEDLRTFGGLMRATGHPWNLGLTTRNGTRSGGARGRRRAVVEPLPHAVPGGPVCAPPMQQLASVEAGSEERSLTGWGKTTRRPRRQRCPAGNPPPLALT